MVFALAVGLLMWLVSRAGWLDGYAFPAQRFTAVAAGIAGLCTMILGVVTFRKARTTVNPLKPDAASTLVVTGIYRWTRNPMYLGALLLLASWAIYLGNPVSGAFLVIFIVYLNRFQIAPEEAALTTRFVPEFVAYKSRVRRWV